MKQISEVYVITLSRKLFSSTPFLHSFHFSLMLFNHTLSMPFEKRPATGIQQNCSIHSSSMERKSKTIYWKVSSHILYIKISRIFHISLVSTFWGVHCNYHSHIQRWFYYFVCVRVFVVYEVSFPIGHSHNTNVEHMESGLECVVKQSGLVWCDIPKIGNSEHCFGNF